MLSQRLFQCLAKLALVAISFASLAPTISHAFAEKTSANFTQSICVSTDQPVTEKVVTLSILTTQGQQLATSFEIKNKPKPQADVLHLEHCPFCGNASNSLVIPTAQNQIFGILKPLSTPQLANLTVLKCQYFRLTPPAQAPPTPI